MVAASHATETRLAQPDSFTELSEQLGEQFAEHHRRLRDEHWLFEVPTRRRRSQLVHLMLDRTRTSRDGDLQPRIVIVSPVGPVPARLPAEMLLRRNATLNAGAICIVDLVDADERTSSHLAVRATRSLHAAELSELGELLLDVATTADELERHFFAHDQL